MSYTIKEYFPVRREQGLSSLDVAVIGDTVQGLVAAAALTQLDFLTIKVFAEAIDATANDDNLELPVNALNALYAISPQLYKSVAEAAGMGQPVSTTASWHRTNSTGAEAMHMPASRGITGPLTVRHSALAAVCLQALPRGCVEFGHALTGLREESDGVTLRFQERPAVTAKLVIACSSRASAAARAVAGSPLGRGRVALLSADQQDFAIEGAVEFAYSISEHGLTPAAVRNYVSLMSDRMSSLAQGAQGGDAAYLPANSYHKAFPPVAQPVVLKCTASPPLGSSPLANSGIAASLKMQEVRPIEPRRGLWSHQASVQLMEH